MTQPAFPALVQAGLDRLLDDLRPLVPRRLGAVALYGGAAKGKAFTGTSDINLLLVLAGPSGEALAALAGPLTRARREARVAPLLAAADELAALARAFPLKYEDIRRHHRLLLGADPFGSLTPSAEDLRADAHRSLANLSLRLKRVYVDRAADPALHLSALEDLLPGAVLAFTAALDPAAVASVRRREEALEDAAKAAGTRPELLLELLALKKGSRRSLGASPAELHGELLATVEALRRGLEKKA